MLVTDDIREDIRLRPSRSDAESRGIPDRTGFP
jgi:hypothetical protein